MSSYLEFGRREKEINLIRGLLESRSDFFLYGIPGSGKTTLLRALLENKGIAHVRINCIQCQTKKTLI